MSQKISSVLILFFIVLASGCATLQSGYETPVVSITSFEAIPTNGLVPQFQIGLHIVNPNRSPLDLKGVSYTIAFEGHKIMTGVSNQLPRIDAYGEGDVVLNASVDLFSSIGFFTDLIRNQKKDKISYSLNAKLDAGSLHPLIRVTKKGELYLTQPSQNQ
ncbi:MAG: LEA type 2 family protein [Proteobacteria bacterium]|nr:LEA type 2 family protein [Pseudomonadota bacterium]MBU1584962.1 LEA type 2 family protein [Pseudomonadota bacterium]MBU2455242.1 LEA type 2 family protein [Pseudomonadota bacterium]MBU2628935.1 LEA type 2 family protein [Pseudomonadota bacterium]